MTIAYKLLLYLHILSAIISIGPFFASIPLVSKLRGAEIIEQNAYVVIFRYAIRLAKHAGHVLVATGVLLVYVGSWSWKSSWIVITVLILLGSLFFLLAHFLPSCGSFMSLNKTKRKSLVFSAARSGSTLAF